MPFHKKSIVYSRSTIINKQSFSSNKPAFTLIELLVAIGVIAILGTIAIFSTQNSRTKGVDSRRKNDLKAINSAIIAYRTDKGHWPPNNINSTTLEYASYSSADWLDDIHPYINKMPNDPVITITGDEDEDEGEAGSCQTTSHGHFYCYVLSADKKTYTLWAQLENANDKELYTSTNATCQNPPPVGSSLTYCIRSPR